MDVLPLHLLEGTGENQENISQIEGIPAKIRKEHLPNKSVKLYVAVRF
jgi:hypothetical protein